MKLASSVTVISELKTGVAVKVATPVTFKVEVAVTAPSMLVAPFTWNASPIVIRDESSELIVVPCNLTAEASTPPVPFGNNTMSSFDLADVILLPLTSRSPPNWELRLL